MPSAKDFGGLVREARTRQGLSVGRVAELVGRAPSTLRGWERGRAVPNDPSVLSVLAAILAINERDLFAVAGVERPQDERVSQTLEQSLREIAPPAMERSAWDDGLEDEDRLVRHPAPSPPPRTTEPDVRRETSDDSVADDSPGSSDDVVGPNSVEKAGVEKSNHRPDKPQEQPVQTTITQPTSVDPDVDATPVRPVIIAPTPSAEAVESVGAELDEAVRRSQERRDDPGVSELVAGWLARWSQRRASSTVRSADEARSGEPVPASTAPHRIPVTPAPYVQTAVVRPSYVEDAEERLTYRMRFVYTAIGMLIAGAALLWAAGEAWEAFGSVWDALFGGL